MTTYYQCPECKEYIHDGSIAHQHPNGEWVHTADLRRYAQENRWRGVERGRLDARIDYLEKALRSIAASRSTDQGLCSYIAATLAGEQEPKPQPADER